ncbi:hypothetical protein L6164_030426 [Bauhinia variegata]|uniref:Uncharacterized protein n=1 Tax=Bauhinia variegata TaxID=167791 RepID=A0ACB9LCF2_BAUVA|nr:hypothetical protein L6164_030426 [Bauhinia variegata]
MGCCISKCRPNKNTLELEEEHCSHVQDKLVISQARAPPTPISHNSNKILPCPPSPTSSTSSISSFTCNTVSSSSSLSTASSALSSKDRSFSNEFLWSCYKENPHIIRINSLKEASFSLAPTKVQSRKIDPSPSPAKPILAPIKQSPPQKVTLIGSSMLQKRVRSSSPANLKRQKSFRKEPEGPISAYNLPSRTLLRSPSPSRRFSTGDHKSPITDHTLSSRRMAAPKVNNAAHSLSHSCNSPLLRKENIKVASPNNSSRRVHSGMRHRETCTYRIGSKIDETVVKEVVSDYGVDLASMEDIDNPLISLDCFIFL